MGGLSPKPGDSDSDSDTSQRRRCQKGATKVVEFLHYKTDGSLKKGNIQSLSDTELIKKQHLTRTAVASSVTGVSAGSIISVACPVAAVGVGISAWTMAVSCINRHRVRQEVKQRARSNADFAKTLREQDRNRKKARDIAVGVSLRGALSVSTMGIVGFDTIAQNFADLGSATIGSTAAAATDATSNAAVQSVSHGATHVASHAAVHATGEAIDPPDVSDSPATIYQNFKVEHPNAAVLDASFHKVTSGIADKTAEVISSQTGLQITGDSNLHEIQDVWHAHDGDAEAKLILLAQGVIDGGMSEMAQPLQQASEYGVEKARVWHWNWNTNQYEKLEDM
ncbi:hypothetical protein J7T55_003045 [Diaporthe amygdali]|uniref:uncharacterized protein n=1 Tax=Phomopsis amygdali TaxID=1214568 RepID=UPI0022FED5F5|nr:uncharacterized protein J7T55_003045 [Diaporthe amygdali]KAJ0122532.1 hypothetical protein J7T55_003045 [Diaporthe amygdali]